MDKSALKDRTKRFGLAILGMTAQLPRTREADVIARQVVRSATSVGANYRAACRARSRRDFISKIGIVEQEADETLYWLQLLTESGLKPSSSVEDLVREAGELVAIFAATGRSAKAAISNRQSEIVNRFAPR